MRVLFCVFFACIQLAGEDALADIGGGLVGNISGIAIDADPLGVVAQTARELPGLVARVFVVCFVFFFVLIWGWMMVARPGGLLNAGG